MIYKSNSLTDSLTNREYEVLRYVIEGKTNKEIAEILTITHHTVKAHIASIIRKYNVRNRLDIARMALKEGIFNPPQD